MATSKKRLLWLDYAKLMGICLVLFGHAPLITADEQWHCFSSTIAVPIFFVISGFLEKGESVRVTLKKSAKSLLLPYVYLTLLTYPHWLFTIGPYINGCNNTLWDRFVEPMIGLLVGDCYPGNFYRVINISMWFLPALFLCKMLFSILSNTFQRATAPIFVVSIFLSIACTYWISPTNYNVLFSLDSAIMAFPLFVSGYYLKRMVDKIHPNKLGLLLFSITSFAMVWILSEWNGRPGISLVIYGKNIWVYYFSAFLGSIGLFSFAMLFSNVRIPYLLYLGRNTLVILGLHLNIFFVFRIAYCSIYCLITGVNFIEFTSNFNKGIDIWKAFVLVIITVLSSGCVIYVINRYFPFIVGKTKEVKSGKLKVES